MKCEKCKDSGWVIVDRGEEPFRCDCGIEPRTIGNTETSLYGDSLSNAERERLALLAEECGETIQIIGKILRHGYESTHPDDICTTNRQLLEMELGDIGAAREMMLQAGDVNTLNLMAAEAMKLAKVKPYLHFQDK